MRNTHSESTVSASVVYRRPRPSDASRIHQLIDRCKPLDLNSTYAYLLLCTHFADTCAVGEREGELAGFVSGYLKPGSAKTLFIWQVAVSPDARGLGVAKGLLNEVLNRSSGRTVEYLETTINPSNAASWALFRSLARDRNADCAQQDLFSEEDFGAEDHEAEQLLRIGPFEN